MDMQTKTNAKLLHMIKSMGSKRLSRTELHDIMRDKIFITYAQMYTLIKKGLDKELIKRRKNGYSSSYILTQKGKDCSKSIDVFEFMGVIK